MRDEVLLLDMLLGARHVRDFTEGVAWERFSTDRLVQSATKYQLQVIGEAAGKISQECREAHTEIAWEPIVGLRHRLVHDYPGIDLTKIWEIVATHIPPLIEALEPLVPPDPDESDQTS